MSPRRLFAAVASSSAADNSGRGQVGELPRDPEQELALMRASGDQAGDFGGDWGAVDPCAAHFVGWRSPSHTT
jgi:hypothetical protein